MKILVHENSKKIDSVLEPVSNMCDEHRANERRRRKLDGDQKAFFEDKIRNMNSHDRERLLNQTGGDPLQSMKPRYITREEASKMTFADAGGQILKPLLNAPTVSNELAKTGSLPSNPGTNELTRGSVKVLKPDLSKEKIVEAIHERNAQNIELQRKINERITRR